MSIETFLALLAYLGLLFVLTPILGSYMASALSGKRVFLTTLFLPLERLIYRLCLIDADKEMHWKKYAQSVLIFSGLGIAVVFLLQLIQTTLPLNPQALTNIPWPLALNTAVSFVTNTNWQAYSGESTLSYFVQSIGLCSQNFISAAVGIAVLLAFIRGLIRKDSSTIGNFWADMVRSFLYVLLPLSLVLAIALTSQGVVQNISPYVSFETMEGHKQTLPMGPAASQVAIKQLGTNGGGFFGVNSAHPFENPTPFSNFLQMLAILLIPSALVYMFGVMVDQRKHALMIYLVMIGIFLCVLGLSLWSENQINPALNLSNALEGKEVRLGKMASVLWGTATTAASNGSVNAMHDSMSPVTGGLFLLQMVLGEVIFGGVGSGLYGMLLFVLLTVFIAGLMVGRTPEYLGKKVEAFDIQMAVLAIILPSAVVLLGAAISLTTPAALTSLANSGPHGLSEILYAWGSAANNNGSAFAGLNVNTNFYNLLLSAAMLIGRFGVIIPVLAIAGNLANKKITPASPATLATDEGVFAVLLISCIIIIGALTFFPALALGPLVENLLMVAGRTF